MTRHMHLPYQRHRTASMLQPQTTANTTAEFAATKHVRSFTLKEFTKNACD